MEKTDLGEIRLTKIVDRKYKIWCLMGYEDYPFRVELPDGELVDKKFKTIKSVEDFIKELK